MFSTFAITIGRNVGPVAMSDIDWASFQTNVKWDLDYLEATLFAITNGTGQWQQDDGEIVKEDCAAFVGIIPLCNVDRLRDSLAATAKEYRQDGIGLIIQDGTDTVVLPQKDCGNCGDRLDNHHPGLCI